MANATHGGAPFFSGFDSRSYREVLSAQSCQLLRVGSDRESESGFASDSDQDNTTRGIIDFTQYRILQNL